MRAAVWTMVGLAVALQGCATQSATQKLEGDARKLQLDLARTFVSRKAYAAAAPLLKKSLADDPDNVEAATLYAVVLRETGLTLQAEAQFQRVLARNPRYLPAQSGLALVYDLQKRFPEAEAAHRRVLELAPNDAHEWNNLGFVLYLAGRDDEAITALEKALALAPDLAVAHNNLGFAYARKQEWEKARRCFGVVGGTRAQEANVSIAQSFQAPAPKGKRRTR